MSLPSQQRSFGGRVGRRGRGSGGTRFVVIAVVVLTAAGAGWVILRDGGEGGEGRAPGPAQSTLRESAGDALREAGNAGDRALAEDDDVALVNDDGFTETGVLSAQVQADRPEPRSTPLAATREPDRAPADERARPTGGTTDRTEPRNRPRPAFGGDLASLMHAAREHLSSQELVAARSALNEALRHPSATPEQRAVIRDDMATLNQDLFFSRTVYPDDPIAMVYTVQPGDSLERITNRNTLTCDWRLIQRINGIDSRGTIRVGQKLKLVQGPFHAVVDKSDYRIDLYAGSPGAESQWVYIRSFEVGLGEGDSTPVGRFVVKHDSKLINPNWHNPRTGEFFAADNPDNPIGEHWIGIEGVDESAVHTGFGLHGTIDPDSIGSQASMGCVRMRAEDIATVYDMLTFTVSEVHIRP